MKIGDWFKNLLSRFGKKDYMLNERNTETHEQQGKTDFVQKVDVNAIASSKSREDILMSLREDIMVQDLSEEYNYGKFSPENIRHNYDKDGILSDEDNTALSCLFGAITSGNSQEFKNHNEKINNKINAFLEENPNNIVVLVNLMIRDAETLYARIMSDSKFELKPSSARALIPGSYGDISRIIEEYNKEKDEELMQSL